MARSCATAALPQTDIQRPPGWRLMDFREQDAWMERHGLYLGCPICEQRVRNSCYHDGLDYSSVLLKLPEPPRKVRLEFTEEELEALKIEFFPRMTTASIAAGNKLAARAIYEIDPRLLPWAIREEIRKA